MVGDKIRVLREGKRISSKDFAERLNIDLSTLNRIENGKISSFKPALLLSIAEHLKVNVAELFNQNAPTAIQHNEQGDNINVLHQQNKEEKVRELYETLLKTKDDLIQSLKQQIEALHRGSNS